MCIITVIPFGKGDLYITIAAGLLLILLKVEDVAGGFERISTFADFS